MINCRRVFMFVGVAVTALISCDRAMAGDEVKLPPGVKMPPQPRVWRAPSVDLTPPPATARWGEEWVRARPLPVPLAGHAAVATERHIYIIGGVSGREHLGQRDVWFAKVSGSGKIGKWKKTKPFPVPVGFAAVAVAGRRIYVTGGSGRIGMQHVYNTVYSAEIRKRGGLTAWREERALPASLIYHAAAACEGYLYVLGGFNKQEYRQVLDYARINDDGSLGEWRTADALYPHPIGRTFLTCVGNDLVVVGGLWYDSQGQHVTSLVMRGKRSKDGNVSEWTGKRGIKVASGPLRYSLAEQAGLTHGNFVYLFGGSGPDSPGVPTTQASWIDPRDNSVTAWQFGPKLRRFDELGGPHDARVFQTAAAIVGDYAFVLGGYFFVREPTAEVVKMRLKQYEEPAWLEGAGATTKE